MDNSLDEFAFFSFFSVFCSFFTKIFDSDQDFSVNTYKFAVLHSKFWSKAQF